jgi:hypothetical protein
MPSDSVLCSFCEDIPMHHRCMHPLDTGGKDTNGNVCGVLICAPCSAALGNDKGNFCCMHHSTFHGSDSDSEEAKENSHRITPATAPTKKKVKVISKSVKASEYTAKDLLVLS